MKAAAVRRNTTATTHQMACWPLSRSCCFITRIYLAIPSGYFCCHIKLLRFESDCFRHFAVGIVSGQCHIEWNFQQEFWAVQMVSAPRCYSDRFSKYWVIFTEMSDSAVTGDMISWSICNNSVSYDHCGRGYAIIVQTDRTSNKLNVKNVPCTGITAFKSPRSGSRSMQMFFQKSSSWHTKIVLFFHSVLCTSVLWQCQKSTEVGWHCAHLCPGASMGKNSLSISKWTRTALICMIFM